MNEREIQNELEAWMPGDDLSGAPEVAAALEEAQRSPQLQGWLERKVAFDAQWMGLVSEVPVPPGAQQALVAQMVARRRRAQWSHAWCLAAAFTVLLTLVGGGWWRWGNPPELRGADVAAFQEETLRYSRHIPRLAFRHEQVTEVQRWLAEAGAPLPTELPAWVADVPAKGCRVLSFNDQSVSLICFAGRRTYHLYFTPRPVAGDDGLSTTPEVRHVQGWSVAAWADERFVYSLNVRGPLPPSRQLAAIRAPASNDALTSPPPRDVL